MTLLSPAGAALVRVMGEMPRGPKREGVFALWLTLRVAEDLLLLPPPPERGTRRRVAALEQRLSSLSLPAPLRRALVSALAELKSRAGSGWDRCCCSSWPRREKPSAPKPRRYSSGRPEAPASADGCLLNCRNLLQLLCL